METTPKTKNITDLADFGKVERIGGPLQSDSNPSGIGKGDENTIGSNDDSNPHILISSETTTNESLSNISTDNNINQSLDISNASTPSSSSVVLKNNGRSKLSIQNVRILLYFIFEIKPFKYVGDRSINQTRKWEIIQEKYAQSRKNDSFETEFVVPTVRTLQRQLASAIKKAKLKKEAMNNKGIKISEEDITSLFKSIGPDSSTETLELALLELHEYSERLKNGKASNSPIMLDFPKFNKTQEAIGSNDRAFTTTKDKSEECSKDNKVINNFRTDNLLDEVNYNNLDEITITRNNITKIMAQSSSPGNVGKLAEMLELLLSQTQRIQQKIIHENNKIIQETSERIKEHQDLCERLIKENNKFQEKQNSINRDILISILGNFSKLGSNDSSASNIDDKLNNKLNKIFE